MEKIKIIIDSTFGMTDEFVKENNIDVIPLNVIIDGESYLDEVTINVREVVKSVESGKVVTTSQANPNKYLDAYEKAFTEGADKIVCLTISSTLSGTFTSANVGKSMCEREKDIYVVDTIAANVQAGLLLEKFVKVIKEKNNIEQAISNLEKNRKNSGVIMCLKSLDGLFRSGRISRVHTIIGNILNIKAIISFIDGKVSYVNKVRSDKKSYIFLGEYMQKIFNTCKGILKIKLTHIDALDKLQELKEVLKKYIPNVKVEIGPEISSIIAIHVGYGGIGIGWMVEA